MTRISFGFDPGLDGGVAAIIEESEKGVRVEVIPTPTMPHHKGGNKREVDVVALCDWIKQVLGIAPSAAERIAAIEDVHSMPDQGIVGAFTFGDGFGALKTVIRLSRLPMVIVKPKAWKDTVLAGQGHDKAGAIAYVRSRFPSVSLKATERCRTDHDGMAEAICIAEYARKQHTT